MLLRSASRPSSKAFAVGWRAKDGFSSPDCRTILRERLRGEAAHRRAEQYVIPPDHRFEVDEELWGLLDICSNEELEEIYKILYGKPGLFSPSSTSELYRPSQLLWPTLKFPTDFGSTKPGPKF